MRAGRAVFCHQLQQTPNGLVAAGVDQGGLSSLKILRASGTDRAMPAIPPAELTAACHACCSGDMRPVGVLTSMEVKTATCWPTISGVMVTVRQPIRSALPLQRPNWTGRPCWSLRVPVLLRNNRKSGLVPSARRIFCWIVCSDDKHKLAVTIKFRRTVWAAYGFTYPFASIFG